MISKLLPLTAWARCLCLAGACLVLLLNSGCRIFRPQDEPPVIREIEWPPDTDDSPTAGLPVEPSPDETSEDAVETVDTATADDVADRVSAPPAPAPRRAMTQIVLEQVVAFRIDLDRRYIDFAVVIRNKRPRDAIYLRDVRLSDVHIVRDEQSVPVGLGTGGVVTQIEPAPGVKPMTGVRLEPGLSTHFFRMQLPKELASAGENLCDLFNILNTGSTRLALLFNFNALGGIADPNGVEWLGIELTHRFTSEFARPFHFDIPTERDATDTAFGIGTVDIRRIEAAAIVTENDRRLMRLDIAFVNHDEQNILALINPDFSHLAFHGPHGLTPIGEGIGRVPGTVSAGEGFPDKPGIELPPNAVSIRRMDILMPEDETLALRNLVDILNLLGDPARREELALLAKMQTKAGIKSEQGIESFSDIETYKRLPLRVQPGGLFQ